MEPKKNFVQEGKQFIMHVSNGICTTKTDLLQSRIFKHIADSCIADLQEHKAPLLEALPFDTSTKAGRKALYSVLRSLIDVPLDKVARVLPLDNKVLNKSSLKALNEFVERLYNYWRKFDRFVVLHSEPGPSSHDKRPYRAFNATAEELAHLVRAVYRDISENITGDHPNVYRQVAAGCNIALIAISKKTKLPLDYHRVVDGVPFIRQVWIAPPLIIDPPMNKRTGRFQKVNQNPVADLNIDPSEWLCYPARVGPLVIFLYFHQKFIGLGCSLANLFELATDEQIVGGPDALYLFGAPSQTLAHFGELPTVFFDDEDNNLLVAAVPAEDRFGYFGYLKKMTLTLHNIVMMKRGMMPYHGAMVRILMKNGKSGNILIIGDTAAGKSETLEALRVIGDEYIREMRIIADDMGTLEMREDGSVAAYGTEIGAFIRLDDLQQGYAFGQIDRAIFMSPQKINARVVLPVTTIDEVLHGYPIDFLLYANNYEEIDDNRPVIERFLSVDKALDVFRESTIMSKGTTTSHGLVHTYFANIFGPPQYENIHEGLARHTFNAAMNAGVWVGQLRTRLGIAGYETKGPEAAAKTLLNLLSKRE